MPVAPLLIVDAANVVGSRPDGWWRDRAKANARLRDELVPVTRSGLPGLPPPVEVVLVVEGAARRVASTSGVRVVAASGAGDDTIVDLVGPGTAGRQRIVVTADRELRVRVARAGALVRGPRWLWSALAAERWTGSDSPAKNGQVERLRHGPDRF